jgi:hypothetical protein
LDVTGVNTTLVADVYNEGPAVASAEPATVPTVRPSPAPHLSSSEPSPTLKADAPVIAVVTLEVTPRTNAPSGIRLLAELEAPEHVIDADTDLIDSLDPLLVANSVVSKNLCVSLCSVAINQTCSFINYCPIL